MQKITSKSSPRISQLFQEQKFHEVHRKRLEQIKAQRKQGLIFDTSRDYKMWNIKQNKSKSFALKFNQSNRQITKENMILFTRLKQAQKSHRKSQHNNFFTKQSRTLSQSMIRDRARKQAESTQKQNLRLAVKLKSISSSLNAKSMLRDYHNKLEMRNRIQKFENIKGLKISLKSQNSLRTINKSRIFSQASLNTSKMIDNPSLVNSKLLNKKIPPLKAKTLDDKQQRSHSLKIKVDNSVKKNFFQKQAWKTRNQIASQRYITNNKSGNNTNSIKVSKIAKIFQQKQKVKI